ncbi:MAG: CocE/NonD family hydrolase [Acidobacteriaceae bacterium]|nr:CocE/NonD family hydrolase [Acidobacteriaceae bacterium]
MSKQAQFFGNVRKTVAQRMRRPRMLRVPLSVWQRVFASFALPVAAGAALALSGALFAQLAPKNRELSVLIPMRDGVRLAADVFLPANAHRFPAVLVRTPYNRRSRAMLSYHAFLGRGYAVVIQDTRGRYASEGVFGSIQQEGPDGNDTINWIAEQPWSNGRVAMAGSSYLGIVQWWAAIQNNRHLLAIMPMNAGTDEYLDRYYSAGGAFQLAHRLIWLAQNFKPRSQLPARAQTYLYHVPLSTSDVVAAGAPISSWRQALAHASYDTYWSDRSIRNKLGRVSIPVLLLGGWFDPNVENELDAFTRLSKQGAVVETWIGPWAHDPTSHFPAQSFGTAAQLPIRTLQAGWLDRWLDNGPPPPVIDTRVSRLHLFVMGPNIWREEHEWPLLRARFTSLYLNSEGHANSASGDGVLTWQAVKRSKPDKFSYDPSDPVPTAGGAACCDPKLLPTGPLDQSEVERRSDVLVYTSAPLTEPVEVTGPLQVVLYVSTSANDTDFTAKIVDVQPDGRAILVCDGILRLRYRLSLAQAVFVKRNTPYRISIDAGVTSCVFAAGHRIRLEVSSSNFPRFDRNLNSTGALANEIKIQIARQTVLHETRFPSAVILPLAGPVNGLSSPGVHTRP